MIDKAFSSIPDLFRGFGEDKSRLYEKCLRSEREHRNGHPAPVGFSAPLAARYFAVKWLRGYASGRDKLPAVVDYLHIREECFIAAAMSVAHGEMLRPWATTVGDEFDALDYAEMMS